MAPPGDDHYHPKDAVHAGFYGALATGGTGLLFAAVRNSLAVRNIGPWTTFTKHGGIIATFAAVGGVYEFTRAASANLREKEDHYNEAISGFLAGAVMGIRTRRMPRVLGYGALMSVALTVFNYTGSSLKGYWAAANVDEYERKEMLRKNRRRPIEETLAEIGEGRGIRPPGYEERRRERLKERYGIDINTVSADPDA
ncbi:NADH-ubiquinone oxidoreductase 21.3 kDa subunit [Madurella fahalii]|uniref:NADH-ubiquinone oxidoreductase 21.3 kDa subunit n=1 Tax=Madurella fahalii TaxID=1157608 RepID=A0ABQ0GIC6_9PEZI